MMSVPLPVFEAAPKPKTSFVVGGGGCPSLISRRGDGKSPLNKIKNSAAPQQQQQQQKSFKQSRLPNPESSRPARCFSILHHRNPKSIVHAYQANPKLLKEMAIAALSLFFLRLFL